MVKWRYKLEFQGKALRETINNGGEDLESCKATLQVLKNCYDQIKRLVEDDWWNFESDYESLEHHIEVLNNPDESKREDALLDGGYDGAFDTTPYKGFEGFVQQLQFYYYRHLKGK